MSQKGTVLVVDDNRLVLAALVDGLSRAGYSVLDADNGDDAILLAREHRPDLALLDIRMEGKSGFDVAAYLRTYCRMPFLFLSAFADDQTVAKVKALGAIDYLVKPLEIGQIVAAIDAAFVKLRMADPASTDVVDLATTPALPAPARPSGDSAPASTLSSVSAGSASASALTSSERPQPRSAALGDGAAMAAGVLMHRYSLARDEAVERLRGAALADGRPLAEQAERILAAVEALSLTSPGR